jgi:hypothetical protein
VLLNPRPVVLVKGRQLTLDTLIELTTCDVFIDIGRSAPIGTIRRAQIGRVVGRFGF